MSSKSAVHETMAEIASLRVSGIGGMEPTKLWEDYYSAVSDVFGKYVKPKGKL